MSAGDPDGFGSGEESVSRPLGVSHGATHRNTQQDGFGQMVLGSAKWSRERLASADWVPVALGGLESPAALRHVPRRGLVPPQAAHVTGRPAPVLRECRMPWSYLNDPEHWRSRAKEARAMGEHIADPTSKQMMLDVAAGYERLATRAEERKSSPQSK
jgi:hypothetical protein